MTEEELREKAQEYSIAYYNKQCEIAKLDYVGNILRQYEKGIVALTADELTKYEAKDKQQVALREELHAIEEEAAALGITL